MLKKKVDTLMIHGSVAPGFEAVREEFSKNFTKRGEVGSACGIYHKGKKVVDLWGGYRNVKSRAPWEENTMVIVFSTSKGMASMTMAVAHSRGLISYHEKVATYWPEFAQNGKEDITVRQLLSHQAGLCVIDEPITMEKLANPDKLATTLAKQKPLWEPGTKHGYHGLSLGWYEGELIRRVDPKHRSLGQFFQDEIARPLGIEFYIGLPTSLPDSRIAKMQTPNLLNMLFFMFIKGDKRSQSFYKALIKKETLIARMMLNPRVKDVNDRAFLALENPAYTGVGEARAIAHAYSVFACGGHELGITKETIDALAGPPIPPTLGLTDQVLGGEMSFSLGYLKPLTGSYSFGSSEKAFGTPGAGGSFGFADPDAQVGYAYVTNKMGMSISLDPREITLREAFYASLK